MSKKMLLLSVCLVFVLSLVTFANDAEIKRLQMEIQKNGYTFQVGKTSVTLIGFIVAYFGFLFARSYAPRSKPGN